MHNAPPVFIPHDDDDSGRPGRDRDQSEYEPDYIDGEHNSGGRGRSGEGIAITDDPNGDFPRSRRRRRDYYASTTIFYPEDDSDDDESDKDVDSGGEDDQNSDISDDSDGADDSNADDQGASSSGSSDSQPSDDTGSGSGSSYEEDDPSNGYGGRSRSNAGSITTDEKPTNEHHTEGRYDPSGGDQRVSEIVREAGVNGRGYAIICDSAGRFLIAFNGVTDRDYVKRYLGGHYVAPDNQTVIFQVFIVTPPKVNRYLYYLDGRRVTYEQRNNDYSNQLSNYCNNVYHTLGSGGKSGSVGSSNPNTGDSPTTGAYHGPYVVVNR